MVAFVVFSGLILFSFAILQMLKLFLNIYCLASGWAKLLPSLPQSQNLISDIGGQLGLWLGLSAITFGEIVEFAMSVFRLCTAKFLTKKHRTEDLTPVISLRNARSWTRVTTPPAHPHPREAVISCVVELGCLFHILTVTVK